MLAAKFEQVLHSPSVFAVGHDRVDPCGNFFIRVAITRHLTTNVAQGCLFEVAPHENRATFAYCIAQGACETKTRKRIVDVYPFGVLQLFVARLQNRVTTKLKRNLLVWLHAFVIRHGQSRSFKVNKMQRILASFEFIFQQWVDPLGASFRALKLSNLSLACRFILINYLWRYLDKF